MSNDDTADRSRAHPMRRLGHLAFWFFLLKGLAWLAAPTVLYFWF
ncbi:MAG: hypothetical protein AAFU65_11115 [Pseudomonadota bacterium]